MVIPAHYAPKDPAEYTEPEKEKVYLDSGLQLILNESLDNYEGFMAKPKESITDVFERFNKLLNDLQLHDIYYGAKKVNLKFLLTVPDHLEQKISAIREGRDLSRITLEVLYGILKTYELEMIQRKSLRSGQGNVVDGSSALIEQVILELEKDEFYTLEELDKLDQSMIYLARKFSNIRVKKPRYFKSKGQSFNKDNSWKEKGKYNSDSRNGYKTGFVDRSKIRKPKKAKKDKAYLELKAKYESLLKKQQNKAYIAEGKRWDDSDNDEDEEVGNYALMALEQEMFHIHTSMVDINEEVSRLTKMNEKLENEKEGTELLIVELEAVK
ncbi:hypothetical protein AgCh_038169 [Apium graveolens]